MAFAAGCASNDAPVEEPADTSEFTEAPAATEVVTETIVAYETISISPVYFDLDESNIKPEFESVLQSAATALRESGAAVTIEGHCDERGTREYNLALGDRRASAARDYLVAKGVNASRLTTISYGKERPAVGGSNDTSYALNRRSMSKIN